jgi:predicted SAM-dependent methyltransferase
MIPYIFKRIFYLSLKYPMRASGWYYKNFRCPHQGLKVHLGPGTRNYLDGWVNVDANLITAKLDVWANFLDPLPFRDGSVDILYSHHTIEHLPDSYLSKHFDQIFRILRPGGGIRIGAPHLGNACRKYVEGDDDWFFDFPDARKSLGGKLTNFIFCRGEHLTALDESYLAELAAQAGFINIHFCLPGKETKFDISEVLSKEPESDLLCPHTVILEATKPQ